MIARFMMDPQTNSVAVVVLTALIIVLIESFVLILKDIPVASSQGWYTKLLPVFALTGIPAVLDILQTNGIALVFAVITTFVFGLSIIVPILQIADKTPRTLVRDWFKWSIPILVIGGIAVAGYFTFIEATGAQITCGPSNGCSDVQNSKYSVLLGFMPMGMFGLAGYIAILAGWLVRQYGPKSLHKLGTLSIWGFCIFGVIFSAYLTFLEPFVIGATCMWCIMSAVLMMMLLLISTPAAQQTLTFNEDEEF